VVTGSADAVFGAEVLTSQDDFAWGVQCVFESMFDLGQREDPTLDVGELGIDEVFLDGWTAVARSSPVSSRVNPAR